MTPEFWAGCICGLAQNLIGFPLDSIKTRQQQGIVNLNKQYLYRGFYYQLAGKSILMGSRFHFERVLANKLSDNRFLTGAIMGLLSSVFMSPFELCKVRRQVNLPVSFQLSHLYRGWQIYAFREFIGNGIFFGAFHHGHDDFKLSYPQAGLLGGLLSWTVIHPIDTIKSRFQADLNLTYRQAFSYHSFYSGFRHLFFRICLTNLIGYSCYQWTYSRLVAPK